MKRVKPQNKDLDGIAEELWEELTASDQDSMLILNITRGDRAAAQALLKMGEDLQRRIFAQAPGLDATTRVRTRQEVTSASLLVSKKGMGVFEKVSAIANEQLLQKAISDQAHYGYASINSETKDAFTLSVVFADETQLFRSHARHVPV